MTRETCRSINKQERNHTLTADSLMRNYDWLATPSRELDAQVDIQPAYSPKHTDQCKISCVCACRLLRVCMHSRRHASPHVCACMRACTDTHVWERMHDSTCVRKAGAGINSRTRTPDIHFSTPQNNQAHTCLTHGRHATGQGYRAIAATMPQTLKPNETTLLNLAQSVKLNNHPNTAHSLDKMSGQPNSKHRTPRRHSCGKPSTLSSTTQML